ncbi:hypothetical protein [Cytobacillus purgationiresistens]|uniref:Head fiber protein n=1 Tax=Cytobacillus purgationiresistens TaxID=863449 RepID=A0ABU0AHK1_9BACI|nr:hypothetical protein [Cytobacillus purgationiresistens]MDQ0270730.1 hypothetical protein [Cytobacillus purgationiresistens]
MPVANDVKLGDIIKDLQENTGDGSTAVAWGDVTGKPSTFPPSTHTHTASQISDASTVGRGVLSAQDAAAARTAIGAGTSSLAIGSTASTAAAGNHAHNAGQVSTTAISGVTGANVQAVLESLAAKIAVLEGGSA